MPRASNKVAAHRRRKKFLKHAKGYWGVRKNVWTVAKHHIEKGLLYAYRDRRTKKRDFRRLWITRINAAARMHGTTYSRLINDMKQNNIMINRKVLADFAMNKPEVFESIVKQVSKSA
jgi:large subunit ribosomal protein L20